jgi:hypothetical protein
MTVTTTEIRQTVVNEARERAIRERAFLFVYEYTGQLFNQLIWATLIEGEQAPEDARLLCTVNQEGLVDWKIDDLIQTPIARTSLPRLSEITLPIEEVQFNNVTITIAATDPAAAYAALCQALAQFEYTTDTFQTNGAAGESEAESTTTLFPQNPETPNRLQVETANSH